MPEPTDNEAFSRFDRVLIKLFDVLEPIAGPCPVCAFCRGIALTLTVVFVVYIAVAL